MAHSDLSDKQRNDLTFFVSTFKQACHHQTSYMQLSRVGWVHRLDDSQKAAVAASIERRNADRTVKELEESWKAEMVTELLAPIVGSEHEAQILAVHLQSLADEGRDDYMETLLLDYVGQGREAALRNWKRDAEGSSLRPMLWHGFVAALEVAVVIVALSAVQPGYQTVVVAVLCLIYSVLSFQLLHVSKVTHGHFSITLANEETLRPTGNREEYVTQFGRNISLLGKLYWVTTTKLILVEAVALICLFHRGL
jgi:hypothetical protein